MELLYFANPYCSWCWGFAPVLDELRDRKPDLRISLALGSLGVRDDKPLSDRAREEIGEHWNHVTELSGQPFDHEVLQKPGLTYDTKPACQAVMLVRQAYPVLATAFLGRLGERFFACGDDLSDPFLLGEAAAEFGMQASDVAEKLRSAGLVEAMAEEWQQTARLGVTGYPTLIKLDQGRAEALTIGWASADDIAARL